jgi:hypothetical protein
MNRFAWPVVALAAVAAASARPTGQTAAAARWDVTAQPLQSPAGPHSAQPQLTTSKRGVLLSWIELSGPRATLKFAERRGSDWSSPRTVASGADWFVNWADVPSVFRLDDGTLVAHWLQKSGSGTYAYDVRLSRSTDDGATWSASFLPHHDGTKTEHGFASLFQLPGTRGLGVVWLDGRAMAGAKPGHGGHGGGDMSVRFASFDRSWRQTSESIVDRRVCECCPTAVAVTSDGPVIAYRNRGEDETRDIYVSRFENGQWSEPVAAHDDGWRIYACPVNGPALSADGRTVALAWFTGKNDQPQAYVSFSTDAARTFGKPVRLDDGASNGRVDVELLPDGSAAAMYIEYTDRRPRLNVRRIDSAGQRSNPVTIAPLEDGRGNGYARLARAGDELIFAWTTREETPRVKTAVARLPLNK